MGLLIVSLRKTNSKVQIMIIFIQCLAYLNNGGKYSQKIILRVLVFEFGLVFEWLRLVEFVTSIDL